MYIVEKHIATDNYRSRSWPVVIVSLLLILIGTTGAHAQFAGGTGTLADPFQVSTVTQLQAIKDASNSSHFILINDIDASATAGWNGGQGFEPRASWFNGSINGQGFTISNLTINRPGLYQAALIGSTGSDAEFKNINFVNVSITGGGRTATLVGTLAGSIDNVNVTGTINGTSTVGGLVGQLDSTGSITNSEVDVSVTGSGDYVGGLLGLLNSGASVENINVSGSVSGVNRVGGLTGQANSGSSITNGHTDVTVTGTGVRTGGLVGYNNQGSIQNSSSAGSVSGNNEVGGLIGRNESANSIVSNNHSSADVTGDENVGGLIGFMNDGTIELAYSTGEVSGTTNVGGLVGFAGWGNAIIRLSYSTSNVEPAPGGGNRNQFGGLVGRIQGGLIENSFARGNVNGNNRVGGLVGEMLSGSRVVNSYSTGLVNPEAGQSGGLIGRNAGQSISNSFWDNQTSGWPTVGVGQGTTTGATGKTTSEMLTESTFTNAGWDFNNIWSMDPEINDGYPYLIPLWPTPTPGIYYSRATGAWNSAETWSTESHTGPPATRSPIPPDQVIIGNNHQVTLVSVVTNNNYVTVNNTGTLITGEYILQGSGSFTLSDGATLHIGSADGISISGGTGSIQSLGRSFSSQANYVYDGTLAQVTGNGLPAEVNNLRIDNSAGVTASANLTGLTVNGQLQLDNGIFTMPPGSSLVANNVDETNGNIRMQLTIDGAKGWRMITSPVQTDLGDLLDGFVSQGFAGAGYPNKQPNILWFDETQIGTTNMAWREPSNITNEIVGGRGYFHYVFNGAELSENGNATGEFYEDTLPITMDATGLEHATGGSVFNFGVTYTARSESNITDTDIIEMNTGWNLVGNPSTASLDWDATSGWTRTHVDQSIYIWDPAANGGEGDFLFWNGSTGTLDNGLIAPFQAFWVRSNSQNPLLSMNDDVKTTGGSFIGTMHNTIKDKPLTSADLELKLVAGNMESTAFISFSETGKTGEDPRDAYCLESLSENWLKLYTTAPCCQYPLVINHLPDQLENILHIPIYIQGQRNRAPLGGTYKLSWTMPENWPLHWHAVLMDHAAKKATPINEKAGSTSFTVNQAHLGAPVNKASANPLSMPENVFRVVNSPGATRDRNSPGNDAVDLRTLPVNIAPSFSIVIFPGELPEEIEYMAPEPILLPIYPNPMRDRANIRFNLPDHANVSVDVYDIHGRRIQRIADRQYGPGIHSLTWSPGKVSTGIYFVVMQTDNMRTAQKLVVQQ